MVVIIIKGNPPLQSELKPTLASLTSVDISLAYRPGLPTDLGARLGF